MKDSLERLYQDRDEAEQLVFDLEEEIRNHEEESDEWCSLFHELTEAENNVSYIQAWITSHEGGYEE
jgi:uncharacterized protein YfcZ (UPF0381/DUF406 family)